MLPCLLLLAALAAPPTAEASAPAPPRRLLDRVAAVLDKQPLLLSEVELEMRVALVQRSGAEAADKALTDRELDAALARAIHYRLALAEAERLDVFPPAEGESARLLRAFAARFPTPASYGSFLQRCDVAESSVAAILQRDLRVERYIDSRVQARARISEDDLRERYASRPAAYEGASFQDARERIRSEIAGERYPALVEQLLAELKAKARIRLAAPLAHPPSGASREGGPEGDSQSARP